ncbi:ChaB family protein [Mesorhizobium tianshanense]|uniref:Cation transport regulator ChaB n=1 Tax=Mesorhizobium tianshanense TaxID=39844 RepID=A0A562MBJ5_9HYPH|nr:cation transport regulator ChaB [Mesorhizobium tianshanense]
MPYATNADLPPSVSRHLPEHALDIYREAFNHAFLAHTGDPRQEEASHRIAWAAVKRSYRQSSRIFLRACLAGTLKDSRYRMNTTGFYPGMLNSPDRS